MRGRRGWTGREGRGRVCVPDNTIGSLAQLLGHRVSLINDKILVEDLEDLTSLEISHDERLCLLPAAFFCSRDVVVGVGAPEGRVGWGRRDGKAGQIRSTLATDSDESSTVQHKAQSTRRKRQTANEGEEGAGRLRGPEQNRRQPGSKQKEQATPEAGPGVI